MRVSSPGSAIFASVLVAAQLMSCASEHGAPLSSEGDAGGGDPDDEGELGPGSGATCPDASTLRYRNFGRGFFATYCTSCHSRDVEGADRRGAPSDHNFDTLADIRSNLEHIDQWAAAGPNATNEIMPPEGPTPTLAVRKQLGEWLACGAP